MSHPDNSNSVPLGLSVCRPRLAYETRYGYRFDDALRAEFWWRIEHLGRYRGGDGGLFGAVRRFGYQQRKQAEHRAQPHRRHWGQNGP